MTGDEASTPLRAKGVVGPADPPVRLITQNEKLLALCNHPMSKAARRSASSPTPKTTGGRVPVPKPSRDRGPGLAQASRGPPGAEAGTPAAGFSVGAAPCSRRSRSAGPWPRPSWSRTASADTVGCSSMGHGRTSSADVADRAGGFVLGPLLLDRAPQLRPIFRLVHPSPLRTASEDGVSAALAGSRRAVTACGCGQAEQAGRCRSRTPSVCAPASVPNSARTAWLAADPHGHVSCGP